MKQLLFTKGPQGPIGATLGTAMNNFCSSSNKVSTHYITWLFSFWIWRRRCLKFAWFWPFGALPLGPHGGHTYYLNNFESPTPKDDSCQVWLKSNHAFSRRRWKCKKFTDDGRRTTHDARRTTHDARRTTDDGRRTNERTAIAHSSLRLRWAKNLYSIIKLATQISYIHYESVKLDVLCRQNKIWTFDHPFRSSCQFAPRIVIFNLCICCQFEDSQIILLEIIPMSHHNI